MSYSLANVLRTDMLILIQLYLEFLTLKTFWIQKHNICVLVWHLFEVKCLCCTQLSVLILNNLVRFGDKIYLLRLTFYLKAMKYTVIVIQKLQK